MESNYSGLQLGERIGESLKIWRVPFMCYYAVYVFTPPEDGCVFMKGEMLVEADHKEEAVQKAECRLSRLGFNRINTDYEATEMETKQ